MSGRAKRQCDRALGGPRQGRAPGVVTRPGLFFCFSLPSEGEGRGRGGWAGAGGWGGIYIAVVTGGAPGGSTRTVGAVHAMNLAMLVTCSCSGCPPPSAAPSTGELRIPDSSMRQPARRGPARWLTRPLPMDPRAQGPQWRCKGSDHDLSGRVGLVAPSEATIFAHASASDLHGTVD
jgi:hypothetical protein